METIETWTLTQFLINYSSFDNKIIFIFTNTSMMYKLIIIIGIVLGSFAYSQTNIYRVGCLCYESLENASKVNPDSVKCLLLVGFKFDDFPREILKFKNLRYLEIGANYRVKYKQNYSVEFCRKLDSLFKEGKLSPNEYTEFYDYPIIKKIPKEIKDLKFLEYVYMKDVKIKNFNKYRKIYEYLPNTNITPTENMLKDYHNGTLFGK